MLDLVRCMDKGLAVIADIVKLLQMLKIAVVRFGDSLSDIAFNAMGMRVIGFDLLGNGSKLIQGDVILTAQLL